MGKYSSSEMSIPFSFTINTFFFLTLLFLIQIQTYIVTADEMYTSCAPFSCGNFTAITYPFWSQNSQPNYCGHPKFKLDCQNGSLTLDIKSRKFHILHMNRTSQVLTIAREDLYDASTSTSCPFQYTDVDIDLNFFHYTSNNANYTLLFECGPPPDPTSSPVISELSEETMCFKEGSYQFAYLVLSTMVGDFDVLKCKRKVFVPGLNTSFTSKFVLEKGFELGWSGVGEDICDGCIKSGERCGFNTSKNVAICLSPKKSASPSVPVAPTTSNGTWNLKRKLIVGVVSAVLGTLAVMSAIYIYYRRNNNSSAESRIQSLSLTSRHGSQRSGMRELRVKRFTFSELEQATNNFDSANMLGDGASGTVYFGNLSDGRSIAVKKFNDYDDRKEDHFWNEVSNLGQLNHPSVVSLYGSTSWQDQELLIVYEYARNGTVADHLHDDEAKRANLTWNMRMNIVVQTASALKYLHANSIIHSDIKTSNILLDANFNAKVADFGLSRPLPNGHSHLSTRPHGTPGYVAPEYRQINQVNPKCDVYSFGVVMIELISALKAYDQERLGDDENLSNLAIKKIESQELDTLVDHTLGFDSDPSVNEMIRGVAGLACMCMHSSPNMRPSMDEVLISLEDIRSAGANEIQPEGTDNDEIVLLNQDLPPPTTIN